jgi:hypothetical protein
MLVCADDATGPSRHATAGAVLQHRRGERGASDERYSWMFATVPASCRAASENESLEQRATERSRGDHSGYTDMSLSAASMAAFARKAKNKKLAVICLQQFACLPSS